MTTPPNDWRDRNPPVFRQPTVEDIKAAAEHLMEHKPELYDLSKWAVIWASLSWLCLLLSFWRPAMIYPQLFSIGVCAYYLLKGRTLKQHCLNVAAGIHIMASHLGMTDDQLKEIFDGLRHESSPTSEQSD